MKSFSLSFGALLLASCAGQPAEDPFDPAAASSTDDPWTTEQEVQALREQLGFLKAALESTAPLEEKAIQLFQQGVPRLFAARGSIRRFETHVEQAALQEDRLKIEVLVSHEALFGEAQNQATEGLTHLVFERSTTEQSWGLTDWRVREEVVYQRDQTLFREALASVVDGPLLSSLRRSVHEEKVLDVLKDRDRDWNRSLTFILNFLLTFFNTHKHK